MTRATPLKRSPMKPGRVAKARKPLARVGARGKRNKPLDKAWRLAVLAASGGRCLLCLRDDRYLDAHHIEAKGGLHAGKRHTVTNGAALCRRCHDWAHAHPQEARETLGL